jgi:hypothetical protein
MDMKLKHVLPCERAGLLEKNAKTLIENTIFGGAKFS